MKSIQGLFLHTLKATAFSALLVLSPTVSFAATYYVSSAGNDANSGLTTASPWRTLSKVNAVALSAGDQVLFQRGSTFYGSLTARNSGTSGNPIIYGAYGTGTNPVITGFTTVSAWNYLGGNIWESAAAVSPLNTVNMVVVDGVNTPMGRYPNTGYLPVTSHSGSTSLTSTGLTGSWVGAEIVVKLYHWKINKSKVTSQSGSTLNYSPAMEYPASDRFGFFIQNSLSTLDSKNEWYFNPSTKKLTIYSASEPVSVKVASVDDLVSVQGSYVTFTDLNVTGANRYGFYNANFAITNLVIQNTSVLFSGMVGIQTRSNYPKVDNCIISDSNSEGLSYAAPNTGAVISNNTFRNTGIFPGMKDNNGAYTAIRLSAPENTLIQNNRIISTGYNGIAWTNGSGTVVKNNFVDTYCSVIDDGGGIYTYHSQNNSVIDGNIVINGIGSGAGTDNPGTVMAHGIYLDDESMNFRVTNNSVSTCNGHGIMTKSTFATISGNTVYNCSDYQILMYLPGSTQTKTNTTTNNVFVRKTTSNYVAAFNYNAGSIASIGNLSGNYYARPLLDTKTIAQYVFGSAGADEFTLATWQSYSGQDLTSRKSPLAITDPNDLQFEYNATSSAKTVQLSRSMMDMKGVKYGTSVTLQPFTSVVLIRDPNGTTNPTPSPTPSPTVSPRPSPTPTATPVPSPTPTATTAPSPIPTTSPVPSADRTAPVVTAFSIPATSTSLTITISNFTASDNVGVTGYLLTEAAVPPLASAPGWAMSAASYTFSSFGTKTLFAWAKDAAGNVSASRAASIVITSPGDTTAPVVTAFSIPATSNSLAITISNFTASDNVGVTGYLLTETSSTPSAGAAGWAMSAVTYTFASVGTKSLYAWAKDAAGNVSASVRAGIVISSPVVVIPPADTTAPIVTGFSIPATAASLTVSVTSFTASDNVGVTGYLLTEVAMPPVATASGWSSTKPTAYTFSSAGTKVLYAWVKDTAGNISASRSGTVTITLKTRIKRRR